jgi:hypothetical protein
MGWYQAMSEFYLLYILTVSVVEWSEFLATDPELLVRFPVLPDFLISSGPGTGCTLHREYK